MRRLHSRCLTIKRPAKTLLCPYPLYIIIYNIYRPYINIYTTTTTITPPHACHARMLGFPTAEDRHRVERLQRRARRMGYLPEGTPSAVETAAEADDDLFRAVRTKLMRPTSCAVCSHGWRVAITASVRGRTTLLWQLWTIVTLSVNAISKI